MTEVALRHAFASTVDDRNTNGIIKPSHWNAQHVITIGPQRLGGRDQSGAGPMEEISLASGQLEFDGSQTIRLVDTGITPALYTNATITVDAKGRITEIASGPSAAGNIAALEYLVGAADASLPNARTPDDSATIEWDVSTPGSFSAEVITSGLDAAALLVLIKTVDGASSGLDADLLDGNSSAFYATATSVTTVANDLAAHIADTSDAHDASAISYGGGTGMSATDVEAAIDELATEKLNLSGGTMTGILNLAASSMFLREGGAEGGQFEMQVPASGTTLGGNVIVDINGDQFRVFENGGTNRGIALALTGCAAGAASAFAHSNNLDDTLEWTGAAFQRAALTGAIASSAGSNATTSTVDLIVVIGDNTNTITTGVKGYFRVDFACTLTAWTLLADASGAIKIDVWKDTLANFPPVNADSITNAHEPEIAASGTNAEDTNISDWTTVSVSAGDVLGFNVDSVTSHKQVTLILKATKTS